MFQEQQPALHLTKLARTFQVVSPGALLNEGLSVLLWSLLVEHIRTAHTVAPEICYTRTTVTSVVVKKLEFFSTHHTFRTTTQYVSIAELIDITCAIGARSMSPAHAFEYVYGQAPEESLLHVLLLHIDLDHCGVVELLDVVSYSIPFA